MISIHQYLFSVGNSHGLTRTLGEVDVCRNAAGRMCFTVGNSAVVFKIQHEGRICALRCYTQPGRNLATIYGAKLLPSELFIYRDNAHGEWVDVVLDQWIEGETLHERIAHANAAEFGRLATAFDRVAASLVADNRAHGDLKPENILVGDDGALHLIDLDASFLPEFAGMESPELGTAAFQHPARTAADFDATLDDFPAALISTALHALAIDTSLRESYGVDDKLLIDPHQLPHDQALSEIITLFERHGMAVQYRIARLLYAPTIHLPSLARLLNYAIRPIPELPTEELELFVEAGFWGYRSMENECTHLAPLYDCGFDFTEKLAAVQVGKTWHFIDTNGCVVISCGEFDSVKPFHNGRSRARCAAGWCEIDHAGKVHLLEY